MPPKAHPAASAPNAAGQSTQGPQTVGERSQQRYYATNPIAPKTDAVGGFVGLDPTERVTWINARHLRDLVQPRSPEPKNPSLRRDYSIAPPAPSKPILHHSPKAAREFWKVVVRANLPPRTFPEATTSRPYQWGSDRGGRDIAEYSPEQADERRAAQDRLIGLEIEHEKFLAERALANQQEATVVQRETARRQEMSDLKKSLYGTRSSTLYAKDPEWDDVIPIAADEPEGALAAIAYPEDYAESMSYLRAVMAAKELSPRCLRLTEHIISLNPAHYTVWLYRFEIVQALDIPMPDEIEWLNKVSLEHLKNYQIWHHRQLLMDHYYPQICDKPEEVARVARSEMKFLATILAEDTKNYHVWSYRQYLVRKLGQWTLQELLATQNFIEEDVRNNSAWSHRFFVVFSDPAVSEEGENKGVVPEATASREITYSQEKIRLAPQNQATWNYLRGVLKRTGRSLASQVGFAEEFVSGLGDPEAEKVTSSHALNYLADVYSETGEKNKAVLCLRGLAEKWDPIREGYWKYLIQLIEA